MISLTKFIKLKKITRYFHITKELHNLRDVFAQGGNTSLGALEEFLGYLTSAGEFEFTREIKSILEETDDRRKFEKIHFLYHTIKEYFGYPEPESRFIKTSKDRTHYPDSKNELIIILENLRSAFNVGSIIRACECFGVKRMFITGITPGIDNPKVIKTAKGAEVNIEIIRSDSIENTLEILKKDGYMIAGAETGEGSIDINSFKMNKKTAFIFGNEEIGITSETLVLCDYIISIKMSGMKNSMNVAGAVSVFLYEYSRNYSF